MLRRHHMAKFCFVAADCGMVLSSHVEPSGPKAPQVRFKNVPMDS
jgi:hypothetical protein